jgi:hypothetical protein
MWSVHTVVWLHTYLLTSHPLEHTKVCCTPPWTHKSIPSISLSPHLFCSLVHWLAFGLTRFWVLRGPTHQHVRRCCSPPWTICWRWWYVLHVHPLLSSGVLVYTPPCPCHMWVNWPACADMVALEISGAGGCTWPPSFCMLRCRCCGILPLELHVGAFYMHEVHTVHHSGGEPLGTRDMMFRVCIPSPPQTEHSHSHSCPCAGVHGWHVADMVPSCLSVCSVCCVLCVIHGTILPLLVKLCRLVMLGMHMC